jgi:hypothetical protein
MYKWGNIPDSDSASNVSEKSIQHGDHLQEGDLVTGAIERKFTFPSFAASKLGRQNFF